MQMLVSFLLGGIRTDRPWKFLTEEGRRIMMATPVVRWSRHWLVTDCWRLWRARPPTRTRRPGMVWRTRNLELG